MLALLGVVLLLFANSALLKMVREDPNLIGKTVTVTGPVKSDAALYFKGQIKRATPEDERKLDDQQLDWMDKLKASGAVSSGFNIGFLTRSDSTEPEQAGVLGAIVGSLMMLLVTATLAIPIGVLAATYLEEFAPKNRWTDLIEVNINNLAAVPSIVFGLLGLAVFIAFFGLPRSAPLVGAMVLTLLTLPTIIIASRAALKAVPPSIREAALGMEVQDLADQGRQALAQRTGIQATAIPQGVLVSSVDPLGPAADAGIPQGAIITRIGDRPIASIDDYRAAVEALEPGSAVYFRIFIPVAGNGGQQFRALRVPE